MDISSKDTGEWRVYQQYRLRHSAKLSRHATLVCGLGNNDGHFYYSSTGTSWTGGTIPGGSAVSFGKGLFIIPLASTSNLVSSDGLNWSQLKTGLTNQISRPFYADGLFMAFEAGYIVTSVDGTNWIQSPNRFPGNTYTTDGVRIASVGSAYAYPGSLGYNGFVYLSNPLVSVRLTNSPARKVVLFGLAGRNYQIQSAILWAPPPIGRPTPPSN